MSNIEQYKNRFFNLMESTLGDVKPLINEQQGSITDTPQKPTFPKDDRNLNDLPNTPDGGKKMTSDIGTIEILYPNGKTKSGKCWCSTKGGIVATSCDGIENHCQDATAGWLPKY